jgi:hypothetical protein
LLALGCNLEGATKLPDKPQFSLEAKFDQSLNTGRAKKEVNKRKRRPLTPVASIHLTPSAMETIVRHRQLVT